MKSTIFGFNQRIAVELGLNVKELLLLDYIMFANSNPKMIHIVDNDISYVWLNHGKIREYLPILDISEIRLREILTDLRKRNIIISKTIANSNIRGSKTYYSLSKTALSLLEDEVTCIKNDIPRCIKNDTSRCIKNDTSDNLSINNTYNTSISKDIDDISTENTTTIQNIIKADDINNILDNTILDTRESYLINNINKENTLDKKMLKDENILDTSIQNKDNTNTIDFSFGEKKTKKKNLYEKCIDMINDFTDNEKLKDTLTEYLKFVLEKSKAEHKPLYANQFKGMLNKLQNFNCSVSDMEKSVHTAWEKGYMSFYPVNDNKFSNKTNYLNGRPVEGNKSFNLPKQTIAKPEDFVLDDNGNHIAF